jgi:membrane protein YdbS with pleckstrin-like domain
LKSDHVPSGDEVDRTLAEPNGERNTDRGLLPTVDTAFSNPPETSQWLSTDDSVQNADPVEPTYQPLDPRHVQVERVVALIIAIALGGPALVGAAIAGWSMSFSILWIGLTTGGLCLLSLLIAFLFWWPPISFRYVRWKLDNVGLEIQRGVYWRQTLSVPLARLQHADLTQGPLQRQWGLAKLTVYTAGTEHASVELDGLAHETAMQLRDRLLRQQGVGDVV